MKKLFAPEIIRRTLKDTPYQTFPQELEGKLFIIEYEQGEMVNSPFVDELLLQIVVRGRVEIYLLRDDGTRFHIAEGGPGYTIGERELFLERQRAGYAEATRPLQTLAISIDRDRDVILNSAACMRLIARELAMKLDSLSKLEAEPSSVEEKVVSYMRNKCEGGILKGVEKTAFNLHCSARQLQRILDKLVEEEQIEKIGKGLYRLMVG